MSYYFDHTATATPNKDVISFYFSALERYTANPAATYKSGIEARNAITDARERIASVLHAYSDEVVFTSSGTESINTALRSIALQSKRRGHKLLSFCGEHAATRQTLKFLAEFEDRKLEVLPLVNRKVNPDLIRKSLSKSKADLISLMYVSNSNGCINPIDEVVALRNELSKTARIHVDAVQALGKIPISFKQLDVEYMSFSLHKVGCPKGSGILLIKRNIPTLPLLHGGGQQRNLRSSTENPALAIASAYAIELAVEKQAETFEHVSYLNKFFLDYLIQKEFPFINLSAETSVPHILALQIPSLRSQNLQTALNDYGLEIGIGSACSSAKAKPSEQYVALGLSEEEAFNVVRISFASENSRDDVQYLADKLIEITQKFGTN